MDNLVADMGSYKCEPCDKEFESAESLNQHSLAKHTMKEDGEKQQRKNGNVYVKIIITVAVLAIIFYITFFSAPAIGSNNMTGNVNSSIDVVEYSDFQCPACGAAFPENKKIIEQYGSKIKFTYKHFPLINLHPYAFKAAEAAECAADQGKFWEYHDKLFSNQERLTLLDLKTYASDIGLDGDKFTKCLDSGIMASRINVDRDGGIAKGVRATPSFFINGQKYEGGLTLEKFKQLAGL